MFKQQLVNYVNTVLINMLIKVKFMDQKTYYFRSKQKNNNKDGKSQLEYYEIQQIN